MKSSLSPCKLAAFAFVACSVLTVTNGCGSKQDDLFKRAAARQRSEPEESDGQASSAPAAASAPTTAAIDVNSPNTRPTTASAPTTAPASTGELAQQVPVEELGEIEIEPLAARIEKLRERNANQFAVESITKVGKALASYLAKTGELPGPALYMPGSLKSLSWRVELLPYLGYPNLYKRFDRNVPWEMPPNDALIPYIPDEYLAIHRLDEKTNLLAVDLRGSIWQTPRANSKSIEDGLINTLLVIEANDSHAVTWTEPVDYQVELGNFASGIGELRGGTLALWGTGMATFLPAKASADLLIKAVQVDDGYSRVAADLHQSPSVLMPKAEAGTTPDPSEEKANVANATTPVEAPVADAMASAEMERANARLAVPIAEDLALAEKMFMQLKRERLKDLSDRKERVALAKELLDAGSQSTSKPADSYVALEQARKLAIQGEDLSTAIDALDGFVSRFNVDAYQANLTNFKEYAATWPDRRLLSSQLAKVGPRVIVILRQAIANNFFADAKEVLRFLFERLDQPSKEDTIRGDLGRLATQILAAERKFTESSDSIRDVSFDSISPQAAYEAGLFYCFYKGDWGTGLPLLAECNNAEVASLASADLNGGSSEEDWVRLGDAWLKLSQRASNGIYRTSASERAEHWYRKIKSTSTSSLAKVYVDAKLKQLDATSSASLGELLSRLAKSYHTDLSKESLVREFGNPTTRTSPDDE